MRFARLRMHKWRRNMKIVGMVLVIVILIIVGAQARPPVYDKNQIRNADVVGAPADVAHMDQEVPDVHPVPDKQELVPADNNNNIQIDPPLGKKW